MIWANFLHIYQPANQIKEIFDRVAAECYWPLVRVLRDNPQTKITLNINGALTERLAAEFPDLIKDLRGVLERGQIEFTDSAKYHALLPLLPEGEIERQIVLNREANRRILGDSYAPEGFFPPEMGYAPKILPVLEKLGYQWLIIDEIGKAGKIGEIRGNKTYKIKGTKLKIFFRERGPSNLIMSAMVRQRKDLVLAEKNLMITGMDGETFGHHRPGLMDLLAELLKSSEFEHSFFREILEKFPETEEVEPRISTWASSEKDIAEGKQFISWDDPDNEIQQWQWELQRMALKNMSHKTNKSDRMDEALASDQFFWASAKPWWSLEEIERGAWMLAEVLKSSTEARNLYLKIIAKAFEWQRTGKVRAMAKQMKEGQKIPFKDRTKTEPWVYDAFIDVLKQSRDAAAKKENYEEAILWRDAIWKLETKNDIFDAVHAVDLLRTKIPNIEVENLIKKYHGDYEKIVSGQPEQRGQ